MSASALDCLQLAPPVDSSPARYASQTVHTLLVNLFRGKHVVEIDAQAGDGIACYARAARSALAIEADPKNCAKLQARSAASTNFSVACSNFRSTCTDADFFTWRQQLTMESVSGGHWLQPPSSLSYELGLSYLSRLAYDRLVRQSAAAVLEFDHRQTADMRSWRRLAPLARAYGAVATLAIDERSLCHKMLPSGTGRRVNESRAFCGTFSWAKVSIAIIPISTPQPGPARPRQPGGDCANRRASMWAVRKSAPAASALAVTSPPPPLPTSRPLSLPGPFVVTGRRVTWRSGWLGIADVTDQRCVAACDMVAAYCDEALQDWLPAEAPRYRTIFVYNKCGKSVPPSLLALHNVEFIAAPNVGSNDYAILQHIIRRYDTLANLTVFCEAAEHERCVADAVLRPARASEEQHTTFGSPEVGFPWIHGVPRQMRNFKLKRNYNFISNTNRSFRLGHSGFANMGAWLNRLVGNDAAEYLFSHATQVAYGGFFSAERESIARFPKALYQAIAAQQVAPNEEVDHFIERLWGLLFSVPNVPPNMLIKM